MKVLIIHHDKGIMGGAEEVVTQLSNYLVSHGHGVELVFERTPWQLMRGVRTHIKWADIINVHNFPSTLASFPTRKPIVWMCNEPPELFTNLKRKPIEAFNRWWVRKSKMKVIVADEMQAIRFQGIYGAEPRVIPYGIDYKFWSQGRREKTEVLPGFPNRRLRLLQVGTITPYKNQIESICVLNELILEGDIDASLTLVGGFTDKKYYKEILDLINYIESDERFKGRISLLGQQSKEAIRNLYMSHDVLLHPVDRQGGWLVPFEAMCAGIPVITTPSFTASDIIEDNKLGVVTNVLSCGVERALKEDFSHAGEWVKNNLTWKRFGESMVKVFEEALR